ncbi:nitroreductase [Fontibacillus phaseoli]|uniref:Putative NAD(P)H nitroreductase n=1 Tax=Fontibacillus phaseoli TaxID=1416533 RepID=A0A369BJR0_9BACL|nr:nitroreductase [Fontibacillus phaseoli]RCX20677.1 nitroreductase [Fontibacillus phaseoli]
MVQAKDIEVCEGKQGLDPKKRPVAELIMARRSVRVFKPDPVKREEIIDLLNVAVWAPNHGNRQPWRFILVMDEARTAFADAVLRTYTAEEREKVGAQRHAYLAGVPAQLIVLQQEDPRPKQREEDFGAVCCLIQNFQLAAWEQGLGVVWKTNPYIHDPRFRSDLGIQPGEKVIGVLLAGYAEAVPPARPREAAESRLTVLDHFPLSK